MATSLVIVKCIETYRDSIARSANAPPHPPCHVMQLRLISRKTIDLMTADALPPDVKMGADMFRFEALEPSGRMGQGFGLGFADVVRSLLLNRGSRALGNAVDP